jgi:hypothetical protein
MAFEVTCFDLGTQKAGADLTTHQYKWVKLNSSGDVVLCDTDGEIALGVLQNVPESGEAASVRIQGVSKLVIAASEALTAGDYVGTTSAATATKVDATATGADLADVIMGQMLDTVTGSSPAAALGSVLMRPMGRVTA